VGTEPGEPERGTENGADLFNSPDYSAVGRSASVAVQPRLGLRTEWRTWFARLDCDHSAAAQSVLS